MTCSSRFALGPLVLGCLLSFVSEAEAYSASGTPDVQFTASGPAGLQIIGKTHDLSLREDGAQLVVRVPLANLDTGISLRNKHMREKYLEVERYPNAELTVARGALQVPESGAAEGTADGSFTLHGVTKPAKFTYKVSRVAPSRLHVSGALHVNFTEHGISVPSYLGITVKPDVDVQVSFDAAE